MLFEKVNNFRWRKNICNDFSFVCSIDSQMWGLSKNICRAVKSENLNYQLCKIFILIKLVEFYLIKLKNK
jgi:uncharacterized protein YlaN (UPF0358 family)